MTAPIDTSAEMEPVAPIEDWNIDPSAIQLGELIGEGSFGKVYKAKYLGIDVAVKKILESVEQAQEFEHEVAVLKYVQRTAAVSVSAFSFSLLLPCIRFLRAVDGFSGQLVSILFICHQIQDCLEALQLGMPCRFGRPN